MNFPGVLYSVGSRGDEVAAIQRQLNKLGFNVGTATGFLVRELNRLLLRFKNKII
jgi:hypothetical protein